jgi:ssDNA-binding Zn-finger/Zn-ribbon topoisomerase 1
VASHGHNARVFRRRREKRAFRELALEEAEQLRHAISVFSSRVAEIEADARRDLRETAGAPPACPTCGASLRIRVATRGRNVGGEFWGCRRYPECRYAADVNVHEPTRFLAH